MEDYAAEWIYIYIYINSHTTHMYFTTLYIYTYDINVKSIHFIDTYIYIYIDIHLHIYVYMYIYIYIVDLLLAAGFSVFGHPWRHPSSRLCSCGRSWGMPTILSVWRSFQNCSFFFQHTLVHTRSHVTPYKMKTHVSFLTFWCMQLGPIRKWSLHAQKMPLAREPYFADQIPGSQSAGNSLAPLACATWLDAGLVKIHVGIPLKNSPKNHPDISWWQWTDDSEKLWSTLLTCCGILLCFSSANSWDVVVFWMRQGSYVIEWTRKTWNYDYGVSYYAIKM